MPVNLFFKNVNKRDHSFLERFDVEKVYKTFRLQTYILKNVARSQNAWWFGI